ncbi:hypothetical protein CCACVL1_15417 [Corchorus capsularis]|uniref:Uncharacterized protein n=1 Tax=Corchorus capsularis TaxID=210143 RepID=A0A1R3I2T0_COCAP|nr:hypothetical protein CCACVL1_15417 [Corchorus capsularis]
MNSPGGTHAPATATPRNTRRQRRRWCGLGGGRGRGSAPSTPLLHWTFYNANKKHHHHSSSSSRAAAGRNRPVELSARKLAAGLWHLRRSTEMIRCRNGGFGSKYKSPDRSRSGVTHV